MVPVGRWVRSFVGSVGWRANKWDSVLQVEGAEEDSILSSVASQRGAPRRRPRHSDDGGNGPQSDVRGVWESEGREQ